MTTPEVRSTNGSRPLPTLTAADFARWIKSDDFKRDCGCPLGRYVRQRTGDWRFMVGIRHLGHHHGNRKLPPVSRRFVALMDSAGAKSWYSRPACLRALRRAVRETSRKERGK